VAVGRHTYISRRWSGVAIQPAREIKTMAKSIVVTFPHDLSVAEAKKRITAQVEVVKKTYIDRVGTGEIAWVGDVANLRDRSDHDGGNRRQAGGNPRGDPSALVACCPGEQDRRSVEEQWPGSPADRQHQENLSPQAPRGPARYLSRLC
jgi:hypothetical protein